MVETKVPLATPRADEQGLSHEEERVLAEVLAAMRTVRHGYILSRADQTTGGLPAQGGEAFDLGRLG